MSEKDKRVKRLEGETLMRTLARNSAEFEPPPFFAARVSALAFSSAPPWIVILELTARKLAPGFLVLMMVSTLLLFRMEAPQLGPDEGEWLFAGHSETEEELISLDFVVESLWSEFASGENGED